MIKKITLGLTSAVIAVTLATAMAAGPAWNVSGDWDIAFVYNGTTYTHDATLTQTSSSTVTGSGGYPANAPHTYSWVIDSGSVNGNTIQLNTHYTQGANCTMTINGTIASNATMSGTWTDNCDGTRNGTWTSTSGRANAIVPTNKDQCKDDGWMSFSNPSFKNQGECVSWTNHD
jgi:hypothetical protein